MSRNHLTMNTFSVAIRISMLTALIVAIVSMCGCQNPASMNTQSPASDYRNSVKIGYSVPQYASRMSDGVSDSLISYVKKASGLSGHAADGTWTLNGTLTISANGVSSYSATPNDRLRVIAPDGTAKDFIIQKFNAYPNSCNYSVNFTYKVGTSIDLSIDATRTGDLINGTINGTFRLNNARYTESITEQGKAGSGDTLSRMKATGTISGGGAAFTVNEEHIRTKLVSEGTATLCTTRRINNQWSIGSDLFKIESGEVKCGFTGGHPDYKSMYWRGSGNVICNNENIGKLQCIIRGGVIEVWTDTPTAGQVVLESWNQ